MKITLLNCFCTAQPESGNPAAVVENFSGNSTDKQNLAKELNFPVTVFIEIKMAANEKNKFRPQLEFFYPHTSMPLCVHGTLAAAKILCAQQHTNNLVATTTAGAELHITRKGNDDDLLQLETIEQTIDMPPHFTHTEIANMLNLPHLEPHPSLPLTVASVGSPKLLVPLNSLQLLYNLQPNYTAIKAWSVRHKINGIYVYAPETYTQQANFHARGFNPQTGHNEDAATGVAAAALAIALQSSIIVEQGYCIDQPCIIYATYLGKNYQQLDTHHNNQAARVLIGGRVKINDWVMCLGEQL